MLLLSFETREFVSDKKDFSCGILRRIEVSSAGQVLLDHHFYIPWLQGAPMRPTLLQRLAREQDEAGHLAALHL